MAQVPKAPLDGNFGHRNGARCGLNELIVNLLEPYAAQVGHWRGLAEISKARVQGASADPGIGREARNREWLAGVFGDEFFDPFDVTWSYRSGCLSKLLAIVVTLGVQQRGDNHVLY